MVSRPHRLDIQRRVRVLPGRPLKLALLPARWRPGDLTSSERRLRLVLLQSDQLLRHGELEHHAAS